MIIVHNKGSYSSLSAAAVTWLKNGHGQTMGPSDQFCESVPLTVMKLKRWIGKQIRTGKKMQPQFPNSLSLHYASQGLKQDHSISRGKKFPQQNHVFDGRKRHPSKNVS